MNKGFKIPAQFVKPSFRVNNVVGLSFESSTEVQQGRISQSLIDLMGAEGWLIFSENEVKEAEVPKEDADLGNKTKSQRLRNVLYVQWGQKVKRGEVTKSWNAYYRDSMEALINKIKETLE